MSVYDTFLERGYVAQCTDEVELSRLFNSETVLGYIGFDPTATSLHVGSLIPILSLVHLQRAGHRPIVLVGGGTGMVGDPSGKTEMRKILSLDELAANAEAIKEQLTPFLEFGEGKAVMVNNADWLASLNYDRDAPRRGPPFFGEPHAGRREREAAFGDRPELHRVQLHDPAGLRLHAPVQAPRLPPPDGAATTSGATSWPGWTSPGAWVGQTVYGLTFPLITTSTGQKMGKTHAGTVWLDPERTSPYDFYQYWVNCTDEDVERFLKLFTFLPLDQVDELARLEGSAINQAKQVLAYEVTKIVHGEAEAKGRPAGGLRPPLAGGRRRRRRARFSGMAKEKPGRGRGRLCAVPRGGPVQELL